MMALNGIVGKADQMMATSMTGAAPATFPHFAIGWAWAGNTPFQWTKQVASHFGGTRNGMVMHWPKGIKAKGEIRSQFHHVVDVAPTALEATKLPQPKTVDGVPQRPMDGVSMLYSADDAKARSPHHAVLRDVRQPRHLSRRLGRRHPPLDSLADGAAACR
jgi:arylsulfatase A-like enzyme